MLPLGTPAPRLQSRPMTGKTVSLGDFQDAPALLVMVICNHCPFVKHIRQGLVNSPATISERFGHRGDQRQRCSQLSRRQPGENSRGSQDFRLSLPYLHDENQAVVKAYRAACTPDFFLFDTSRKLAYRGQFDGSRPGNKLPVTGSDLRRRRMRCWPDNRFRPRNSPASAATSNGKPATNRTIRAEKSSFVGGGTTQRSML